MGLEEVCERSLDRQLVAEDVRRPAHEFLEEEMGEGTVPARSPCTAIIKEFKNSYFMLAFQLLGRDVC